MFTLAERRTVHNWPVTVNVPQDEGKTLEQTFEADLDVLGQDEIDAIVLGTDPTHKDLLDRILRGWGIVHDESGNPLPFTPEHKQALLRITYVRAALYTAHNQVQNGAGARKNSKTPRAGG